MNRAYLALAVAGAILMAGLILARCPSPSPTPRPDPTPTAQAIASSSTAATASQAVKVTIRRPSNSDQMTKPSNMAASGDPILQKGGEQSNKGYEEIVIEVSQTATTVASSEASASASVPVVQERRESAGGAGATHARLGLVALTAPGILALDYQLLRLDASPLSRPVLGVDLELGLDVAGNAQMAGAGVSVGGKGFATAGGWVGFQGGAGWYLGAGVRF